jgi:hypothetical protein
MRFPARALLLALVMLVTASRGLRAQCSGGKKSNFNTFTVAPAALALPPGSAATFNAGWSVAGYTINVRPKGNNQWYLCVLPLSLNMGTVSGYTKPLSDLQWSLDGVTWTSFQLLVLQPIVNDRGNSTFTLYGRSLLSYATDIPLANGSPATYSANLRFQVDM